MWSHSATMSSTHKIRDYSTRNYTLVNRTHKPFSNGRAGRLWANRWKGCGSPGGLSQYPRQGSLGSFGRGFQRSEPVAARWACVGPDEQAGSCDIGSFRRTGHLAVAGRSVGTQQPNAGSGRGVGTSRQRCRGERRGQGRPAEQGGATGPGNEVHPTVVRDPRQGS